MESFLISAGTPPLQARKYKDEYKFVWAKKLLNELSESNEGIVIQHKILRSFFDLRDLPDKSLAGKERNEGLGELRGLKEIIIELNLVDKQRKDEGDLRKRLLEEKSKIIAQRSDRLCELKNVFNKRLTSSNRQEAGYDLEDILMRLFSLSEIEYKKSYKTSTQQIDGSFSFEGFDYLVEAKWRKDQPNEGEIGSFQRKVDTKLKSTRGIFVSVSGFRNEVIEAFNNNTNILLMDGIDLTHLLEGRIELKELLSMKIKYAAQYGKCHCPDGIYLK
ncbi:MAG: restriction endonuclease [Bacteroides xylanisolvens]